MEKYRPFADQGTGVNPFVPAWSHHRSSLPVKALKVLLSPLVFVRFCLLLVAFGWLGLAEIVCALIPLGVVRYPVYRLLTYIGSFLALLILGIVPVEEALADHRRVKIPPAKAKGAQVFDAKMGTIVLANQQGVADVLYLCFKLCPTFVFADAAGAPVQCGVFGALRKSVARVPRDVLEGSQQNLAEIAKAARSSWRGPVVVFPEGARTNGSCVLAWKPVTFEGLKFFDAFPGTALVGLAYSKTGPYTNHHTVGGAWNHLVFLCFQPFHTVKATWLSALDTATSMKGKELPDQMAFLKRTLVLMIPEAMEVQVESGKHFEFMDFWDAAQSKGYTQKQKPKQISKKKA